MFGTGYGLATADLQKAPGGFKLRAALFKPPRQIIRHSIRRARTATRRPRRRPPRGKRLILSGQPRFGRPGGTAIDALQELPGHSKIEVTKRFVRSSNDHQAEAMRRMKNARLARGRRQKVKERNVVKTNPQRFFENFQICE